MNLDNKSEYILNKRNKLNVTRKEFADSLGFGKDEEKKLKLWEKGKEEVPEYIYDKVKSFNIEPKYLIKNNKDYKFTQIDLFAGIGGIRLGFQYNGGKTVFSSEWDKFAKKTYKANFGEEPEGDITLINPLDIPNHDILLAGFPCQPFSNAGLKLGFEDTRGTLFFNIASILKVKRPKAFMLENVKSLGSHDKGRTMKVILNTLDELNYYVPNPEVLNAYHFGVPQNRERIIIVGFNKDYLPESYEEFKYPKGEIISNLSVGDILEKEVNEKYTISDKLWIGHLKRKEKHLEKGNGFGFSLFNKNSRYTNTISARYYKDGSEALIEQRLKNPRKLTPRECARLQGFPEDYIIPVSNAQSYKQFGNSVCVNVIEQVAKKMIDYMEKYNMI